MFSRVRLATASAAAVAATVGYLSVGPSTSNRQSTSSSSSTSSTSSLDEQFQKRNSSRSNETTSTSIGFSPLESFQSLRILLTACSNIVWDGQGDSVSAKVTGILAEVTSNGSLVDSMLSSERDVGRITTWLLGRLDSGEPGAERVLCQMLLNPSSAKILLSHSELFPALLEYVVKNEFSDISGALKQASGDIALGSAFCTASSVEKVLKVLQTQILESRGFQGSALPHLCAWALACWSRDEDSREVLLGSNTLRVIADVLGKSSSPIEDEDRVLLMEATLNLVDQQAERKVSNASVDGLLTPIIHNGAHAVANLDEDLLAHTINCLASLMERKAIKGETMRNEIVSISLLLKHISKAFFIEADLCQDSLRAALARFIRAALVSEQLDFQIIRTDIWVPRVMTWLFESAKPRRPLESSRALKGNGSRGSKSRKNGRGSSSEQVYQNAMEAVMSLLEDGDAKEGSKCGIGINLAREWLARFTLKLCDFHEHELEKYERGGPTIGMLEERVKQAKEASNELLKACRAATTTAESPPKLPVNIQSADANLPKEYAAAAIQVDEAVAEIAVSKAMIALADLLSDDRFSQDWFLKSGALDVLQKLAATGQQDMELSRLLAILSSHDNFKPKFEKWHAWLQKLSKSSNCRISSNAERALLNSEARTSSSGKCLQIHDGVHLLVPGAEHHLKLVNSCNCDSKSGKDMKSEIDADIVFVHGLNGGPFSSWCIGTEDNSNMHLEQCWPTQWLAKEYPNVRLISLEYKTRVWDWQGAQHSFRELSAEMMKKLSAAGVGERPVIFVAHSMGGLMIKEMMMQAGSEEIITNTKGVVFFSTPHFGSWIASTSWNIFGQRLHNTIHVLRPSEYLRELNNFFVQLCKKQDVPVLSFCEAASTTLLDLGLVALRAGVVPAESAYPGFGEFVMLQDRDHIRVCKPMSQKDISYEKVSHFITNILGSKHLVKKN